MINEPEMIWKETVVTSSKALSHHLSRVTAEHHKNVRTRGLSGPPEFKVLTTLPRHNEFTRPGETKFRTHPYNKDNVRVLAFVAEMYKYSVQKLISP